LIEIDLQMLDNAGESISPWFTETCVIYPAHEMPGAVRLSGAAMREYVYFATAPGNDTLYVAEKKNGITSQLPVM